MKFYPQYLLIFVVNLGMIGLYSGNISLLLSSFVIFIIMILLVVYRREKQKAKMAKPVG